MDKKNSVRIDSSKKRRGEGDGSGRIIYIYIYRGRPLTEDMKSCPRSGGHYYSLYLFPPYVVLDPPSGPETTYAYVCVCGCVAGRHTFF